MDLTAEQLHNALDIFTAKQAEDPHDVYFLNPFVNKVDSNIWATDGNCAIIINKNDIENMHAPMLDKHLITSWKDNNKQIELSYDSIKSALGKIKQIKIKQRCTECNGEGIVYIPYTAKNGQTYTCTDDCPICKGVGVVLSEEEIDDPSTLFDISGAVVQGIYLKKVLKIMTLFDIKTAICKINENNKAAPLYFKLADVFNIIVMPFIPNADMWCNIIKLK